ncbi:MAG TPA: AraC family transcriptional regulator [Alphaproteobacteria bacterium]|nr:AraC family transcriptional regulator [Alphaproteobacteria bacterium]
MHSHAAALSLRSYGSGMRTHTHAFHQIVLPVCGTLDVQIGDAAAPVGRRCGMVIVGGTVHSFRALDENRFVIFDVPRTNFLPDAIVARASLSPFFAIDESLEQFVRYLASMMSSGTLDDESTYHATALLAQSIGRLPSTLERRDGPIGRALATIDTRYAEALTVGDLARAAGMGMSAFHARFRRETGTTPANRLAQARLDHASRLLREGDSSIAEVALSVGFSDQSALTRSFRRRRGITPAALRRRSGAARPSS